MSSVSRRLDDLEAKVAARFPKPIDDQTILDVLDGTTGDPQIVRESLDRLLELVRPALIASLRRGQAALGYCAARGIDWPPTGGVFDLCARQSLNVNPVDSDLDVVALWRDVEARVSEWVRAVEAGSAERLSREEMRAYLVVNHREPIDPHRPREGTKPIPPVLDTLDSERLLRLIGPLEGLGPPDLPLILWTDPQGQIQTSWEGTVEETWTPVDSGDGEPKYLMLAGYESDQGLPSKASNDRFSFPRRIPATVPPMLSDAETARSTRRDAPEFVWYLRETLDRTFLRIEPFLLASIVAGANSLRVARRAGVTFATPQTAINQAAHIASYEHTSDMPPKALEACGWALPNHDHYAGGMLGTNTHTRGTARGALVARVFEKYGIRSLRDLRLRDEDVPFGSAEEIESLLVLIQPLQWDPDPDLPLLIWRDAKGVIRTSSRAMSGQIRTIADINVDDPEVMFLADPGAGEGIPERTIWAADHFRPDWVRWRGREFRRKRRLDVRQPLDTEDALGNLPAALDRT